MLVLSLIVICYLYVATKLLVFKRSIAADLKSSGVGVEQGRVDVKIVSAQGSRKIEYWMNEAQFPVLGDGIGSEIHEHFQNAAGNVSNQTNEIYRFYYLPQSKLILHYERL